MIYYDTWHSPLGEIVLRANDTALTGVFFRDQKYFPALTDGWHRRSEHAPLQQARTQLADFFAGRTACFDVPLQLDGSAFQQRVWQALARIPYGSVVSYGDIAVELGMGREHARAVGGATGRNPISIIVPCHRVLAGNGALTGYAGGLHRKQALLALEGAPVGAKSRGNLELPLGARH